MSINNVIVCIYEHLTKNGIGMRIRYFGNTNRVFCVMRRLKAIRKKVSMKYWRLKSRAREKLKSEKGYELSVRRMTEPETVFGEIKNNRGIRRFLLRGLWLTKISLDVGWLSLAHNMLKKAAVDAKDQGAKRKQSA